MMRETKKLVSETITNITSTINQLLGCYPLISYVRSSPVTYDVNDIKTLPIPFHEAVPSTFNGGAP